MDYIAFPFQRPCSGKAVQHVCQERVDVGIRAETCPRQEQVASQPSCGLEARVSRFRVEIRLHNTFEHLGPEQPHEEVALFPFLI
jgi:hypothetical protein